MSSRRIPSSEFVEESLTELEVSAATLEVTAVSGWLSVAGAEFAACEDRWRLALEEDELDDRRSTRAVLVDSVSDMKMSVREVCEGSEIRDVI